MSDSIHLLTGAYALDALDPDELHAFEDHLRTCDDCRREVAELRETAALVGSSTPGAPPTDLKSAVLADIAVTPQLTPAVVPLRPRAVRYFGWLAAAAAAVVAVVLAGSVYTQQQTISAMNSHTDEVMGLITADDAKVMPLALPSGSSTVVVSMGRNEAMVLAEGVPSPQPGMTYQTWAYDAEGNATPAGTWMPDGAGHAAAAVTTPVTDCAALSVTVEPMGGSPQPTGEPLAMVEF
jgi:anti-sigma-K factor RskA